MKSNQIISTTNHYFITVQHSTHPKKIVVLGLPFLLIIVISFVLIFIFDCWGIDYIHRCKRKRKRKPKDPFGMMQLRRWREKQQMEESIKTTETSEPKSNYLDPPKMASVVTVDGKPCFVVMPNLDYDEQSDSIEFKRKLFY